ncbi:HMG box-containing protein 4 [Parasteatoda tepidariorum]|uniref:HMG box-containing protein 4 n=1 Tax=Parasteatoda tepidariorum TaxID=114398 RepID=UPI00077FA4E2|nr:HMG box-containing protein 4 [Parasteatoda tepidariorum]XP_015906021.1 HMG box-containing protein 4 [Parasteatoda tepidariorum]XP_015906022.1 HMG box-containing protein 4 [Parasteatoda tepidariorum]XP_015906023.1 HMG box-containing protein 4 [Parasteatoda tepidariorum]XP_015906024.1 HMG box-containing protein 4 [Parasteatoda tepidariorum]
MDSPQISRSGRVLKKSAKVKEMEDFDINDLDMQGKPRKKSRTSDEFDEFDDKRVAPIKIPKISLNLSQGKRPPQTITKLPQGAAMKPKPDQRRFYDDSSADGSKESDSSSVSSESSSSSSSSDDSDNDENDSRQWYSNVDKGTVMQNIQHIPTQQEKVVVESYRQSSGMSMDNSEDEASDSALVIAEESNDSLTSRGKGALSKKKPPVQRKEPNFGPRKNAPLKKKPVIRNIATAAAAAKKDKPPGKSKPPTAYTLWCIENRKRIAAASGAIGFGNIGKKLGEAWQALPDKEKMAWRRKAKRLALKNSGGLITTGPANGTSPKSTTRSTSTASDDIFKGLSESTRALGTSAIDSAAYLKLLGDSLSVIGQRLTEHEGQLAVSGIFSVLLDTILCVVGPLLCLTSESPVLNSLSQDVSKRTLDSIAYFMPGL